MRSDSRVAPLTVVFALLLTTILGCEATKKKGETAGPPVIERSETDSVLAKAQVPMSAGSEVDLVERVSNQRALYRESLESLLAYYRQYGYLEKSGWAEKEIRDLGRLPRYPYLGARSAVVAPKKYEAKDSIPQADALYEQARTAHTEGTGIGAALGGGGKTKLETALSTYRQVIEEYPTSDKIADAAFYVGEIYSSDAFKEYTLALEFYDKCLAWKPATEHPALFRKAVIYDYRLRDRDKAVALYKQVVSSSGNKSNVRFAQERIRQLTDKTSHEAPVAEPKVPAK